MHLPYVIESNPQPAIPTITDIAVAPAGFFVNAADAEYRAQREWFVGPFSGEVLTMVAPTARIIDVYPAGDNGYYGAAR
jgi:hypothetical protein